MNVVRMAEKFAEKKHFGMVDRAGTAYIEHPRAVAKMVDGEIEKVVAFLHDTVEDTDTTIDEVRGLFGDEVAEAVGVLTRDLSVPYEEYIARVKGNEIARVVKMADLKHNMDLTRLPVVKDADLKRVEKYREAYEFLK